MMNTENGLYVSKLLHHTYYWWRIYFGSAFSDLIDHDQRSVNHVDSPQSAEAVANKQGTINYEVLCNLSRRLPRIYYYDNNEELTNELLK